MAVSDYEMHLNLDSLAMGDELLFVDIKQHSLFGAGGGMVPPINLSIMLNDLTLPTLVGASLAGEEGLVQFEYNTLLLEMSEPAFGAGGAPLLPEDFEVIIDGGTGVLTGLEMVDTGDIRLRRQLKAGGPRGRLRRLDEGVEFLGILLVVANASGTEELSVRARAGAVEDAAGNVMPDALLEVEGSLEPCGIECTTAGPGAPPEDAGGGEMVIVLIAVNAALLLCMALFCGFCRRLKRKHRLKKIALLEELKALEMQKESLVMVRQMAQQAGWLSNDNKEEVSLFKQAIIQQQSRSRRLSESVRADDSTASQFGTTMDLPAMLPSELDGALTTEFKQRHGGREPTEQEKIELLKTMLEEPSTASAWGAQLKGRTEGTGLLTMTAPATLAPPAWVPTVPSELLLAAQTFCTVRENEAQSDELLALLKMRNAVDAAFVVPLRTDGGGGVRLHPPKLHPPAAFGADGPPPQRLPLMVANFAGLDGVPQEILTLLNTAGPGGVVAMAKSLIEGTGEPRSSELKSRFGDLGAVADGSSDEQLRLLRTLLEVNIESAVELSKGTLTLSHAVTLDDNGRALDPWAITATLPSDTPGVVALPAPVVAAALAGFEAQHGRPATSELEAVMLMRDALQSYASDGAAPRLAIEAEAEGAVTAQANFGAATLDAHVLRAAAAFETAAGEDQTQEAEKIEALKQCLNTFCDGTEARMRDATEAVSSPMSPQQAAPSFGSAQLQASPPMPSPVHLALQVEFERHTSGPGTSASHDVSELQDLGKRFVADFEARSAAAAQLQQKETQNPGTSPQHLTFATAPSITMPKRQSTRPLELSMAAAAFQSVCQSADETTEAIHHRKSSTAHDSQKDRQSGRFDLQETTRDTQAEARRANPRKLFQQMEHGKQGKTFNVKVTQMLTREQSLIKTMSNGRQFEAFAVGSRVSHPKRGMGTVKEFMADGRVRVLFDAGDEHRYKPESMHKISSPGQETLAMALASGDKVAVAKEVMAHHLNPNVIKVDNEGHVTATEELDEEISDLDQQLKELRKEIEEDEKRGVRALVPWLGRKRTKPAPEATPGHARVDQRGKKLAKAKTSAKIAPEQQVDEAASAPAPAIGNLPRIGPAQVAPAPLPAIGTGQQRSPPKPPTEAAKYALPKPSIYGATEPPPAKLAPLKTNATGLPADLPPLPGSGASEPLPSISAIGSAKRFAVKAPQHRPAPPRPPPAPPGALARLMAETGAPPPPQRPAPGAPPPPQRPAPVPARPAGDGWAVPPQGGGSKPPPPPGRPPPGRPKVR